MDDDDKPFAAERAKTGRAGCKRCKGKIETGSLRIARLQHNPFAGEESSSKMKAWHHVNCLFDAMSNARASTRKVESPEDDIDGWENLSKEDQEEIQAQVDTLASKAKKPAAKKPPAKKAAAGTTASPVKKPAGSKGPASGSPTGKGETSTAASKALASPAVSTSSQSRDETVPEDRSHKDHSFRAFRALCAKLADTPAYLEKSALVKEMLTNGTGSDGFRGNVKLWVRLLLPGINKRVYNLQSKQIVKLFSKILSADLSDMIEDLEQGDVANTVKTFFEQSTHCQPHTKSTLTMQEVDEFLAELSAVRSEEEQTYIFKKIVKRCTANDLQMIIRLIKHDLRINAGAKHILDGLHPDAYDAFQSSRVLDTVVDRVQNNSQVNIAIGLMAPILPMLAEACKSVDQAMKRCPNGMYSEIKYDGERVQLHKRGKEFKYFSRSLKAVVPHKVQHFEKYIPLAFPHGEDLILDSEVLLIDTTTGNPLPFGTLGVHKKAAFEHATVCLFVFDCLYYNGEVLLDKTIRERRKILREHMTEVPNHVVFSEMQEIYDARTLEKMIARVLSEGLEGLVLKDIKSVYEPGKRHWLKVKKDYLCGGKMADTADLVPLGAWFGTGNKGGMMSIFLMCCWDPVRKRWSTVTKVHGGFDDNQLEQLQSNLKMVKISKEMDRVPSWLKVTKTHVPDFVAEDPEQMPVWEITGAEFTKHDVHTAGISVRFPRVTRIRDDKTFKEATNLHELRKLFENSRNGTDVNELFQNSDNDESSSSSFADKVKKEASSTSSSPKTSPLKRSLSKTLHQFLGKAEPSSKLASPSKTRGNDQTSTSGMKRGAETSLSTSPSKKPAFHKGPDSTQSESSSKRPVDKRPESSSKRPDRKQHESFSKRPVNERPETSSKRPETSRYGLKSPVGPKTPLPDVFARVRMVLPSWASTKREELVRYFVAYGGEVLNGTKAAQATHALYDTAHPPLSRGSVRCVSVAWLWDSMRAQTLQPVAKYAPNK